MFFHSMDFEPANDDGNHQNFNWAAFNDSGRVHDEFLFMQVMQAKGATIVFCPWVMPLWMTTGVGSGWAEHKPEDPIYRIPENMYDEAIELIAAELVRAKNVYGADIRYISFNEPNGDWGVYFSPTEMVNFIKKAGPRFEALGLNVKWLMGDTYTSDTLVNYTRPQLEMLVGTNFWKYVGPISFHSYALDNEEVYDAIYDLAEQYNLPVWCEEAGLSSACADWNCAFNTAKMYQRILHNARASATAHWAYGKFWPIVDPATINPYPMFFVLKQLGNLLPSGSQIVEASANDLDVLVLAAKNPGNKFSLQLINTGPGPKSVSLSGVPVGNYAIIRTSSTENTAAVGSLSVSGSGTTTNLPAQSITAISSDGASGDTTAPAAPSGLSVQ
jgi:O-glycosyl hydrolase